MPETPRFYRLRIRNAADTADVLVVTSVRGGTNPYIARPPSGDGQSFDPVEGSVKTGAYTLQVIDADLGAGSRVVTAVLADATARQQLLSNRAYLDTSTDGSSWVSYAPGYVNRIALVNAITFEIAIGDTRRTEVSTEVFKSLVIRRDPVTKAPTLSRFIGGATYLIGGPVKSQFWTTRDNGGWRVKATQVVAGTGAGTLTSNGYVQLKLQRYGAFDPRKPFYGHDEFGTKALINYTNEATQGYFVSSPRWQTYGIQGHFPGLIYRVENLDGSLAGWFTPIAEPFGVDVKRGDYLTRPGESSFWVNWTGTIQPDGTFKAAPSVGTAYNLYMTAWDVSDTFPLHIFDHPVNIHEALWLDYAIAYDASVLAGVRAALGNDLRLALRLKQGAQMNQAEQMIDGLFGMATRVNGSGQRVLFTTRVKDSAAPATVITAASLRGEGKPFDLDEGGVANKVTLKQQRFITFTREINDDIGGPGQPDGLLTAPEVVEVENGDSQTPGDHETVFEIPGRITNAAGAEISPEDYITGVAQEMFDRFGRGPIATDLPCLPDVTAVLGEEVTLSIPHLPNAVAGASPVSQRGGNRIVQVVQRTETPEGPQLRFLDAGTSVQAPTQPTFTVAASSSDPRKFVDIAITNAAALAAGGMKVRIEVATGPSAPTSGTLLTVLDPAVQSSITPHGFDAGTKVWVRMRSELTARRPSAWTAFSSVDLTDLDPPTSLAVSAQDAADISRRILTWVPGTNALDIPVEVYTRLTADPSSTNQLVAVLPAGSDQFELTGLDVANRTVTVLHREQGPARGASTAATVAVNTTGTAATLPAPTNPQPFAGTVGGRVPIPIADGSYGMTVSAAIVPSGIEVAVAVGAGAFVSMGIIDALAGVPTRWVGSAPNDGLIRHMKARHVKQGYNPSPYTSEVTIYPWSVFDQPVPDIGPKVNFIKQTGTILDIIGNDPATKSIRVYDVGGTWEYVVDGVSAIVDVSKLGTNGVAGLGASATATYRVQARSDPTVEVDADTLIDSRDVVVSGGSAPPAGAAWDTVSLTGPAVGSANVGINLKATAAPAGYTVKLYISYNSPPTVDHTADVSPALSAPPTSLTTYTYTTEYPAVHDPPRVQRYLYVKADLLNNLGAVVDSRSVSVGWMSSNML